MIDNGEKQTNSSSTGHQTVQPLAILADLAVGGIACLTVVVAIMIKKMRHSSSSNNTSLALDSAAYEVIPDESATALTKNKAYMWLPPEENTETQGLGDVIPDTPATLTKNKAYLWLPPDESNPEQSIASTDVTDNHGGCDEIIVSLEMAEDVTVEKISAVSSETDKSGDSDGKGESDALEVAGEAVVIETVTKVDDESHETGENEESTDVF